MAWKNRQIREVLEPPSTQGKLYQKGLSARLAELKGSAIKEKGILAISAVCCGAPAVPIINNYLKTYYGGRMEQCIALLQVLNWIEDFSAIQLLLSVANRFRTKGIQEEAERLVNQLAERKGWTKDELSDRTIPWCGFTEKDKIVLDYGTRQFTAILDKDFNFILSDSAGKTIKSLPEARKEDDEEQVKVTKKLFTDAKKQLKQVLTLQKERLFSFKKIAEENQPYFFFQNQQIPLIEIPSVLLSQVWSELQTIASQGTGYDPDWEKKSEY